MPSSPLYLRGRRAARAGRSRTPPGAGKRAIVDPIAISEWHRGYDSVPPPASALPVGADPSPAHPPAAPAAPAAPDTSPAPASAPAPTSDVPPASAIMAAPEGPPPTVRDGMELRDVLDAGGLPDAGGVGMVPGSEIGGTCYRHSLGSQRCVARMPDGSQCPSRTVRPMARVAADRIGRRSLALLSSAVAAIADVPDPGVEDAEAEGVGSGIFSVSERAPWLNENTGGLVLGSLTVLSYPVRVAFHVRREKQRQAEEAKRQHDNPGRESSDR